MAADISQALQSTWMHSHEEDKIDLLVFRGPDYPFPPSRGRTGFTMKPGGVVDVVGPGPDDRRQAGSGRWTLTGKRLVIKAPTFSGTFDVEAVDDKRLVVRQVQMEK